MPVAMFFVERDRRSYELPLIVQLTFILEAALRDPFARVTVPDDGRHTVSHANETGLTSHIICPTYSCNTAKTSFKHGGMSQG